MRLMKALIETPVARQGMLIGEALRICVDKDVPGIPFAADSGRIIGRFSVRNVFLHYSIPSDMIKGAHLIGHEAFHLDLSSDHYEEVFRRAIDNTILDDAACLASTAQITKAMALMEKFNSSYLFVIDEGEYRGVVTRLGLTRVLLDEQG
ncbi:MAG: CBS domain-containing protein [Chromatiaceae bacterium]|nr:CBS domain-containing protein [Chromatiaceae bacterium]MCP5440036.1 CBS domain-containing protein [Chromatiaceae bacterium]